MARADTLTSDKLKEILIYHPETGVFIWRKTLGARAVAGSLAGCANSKGYYEIKIDRKIHKAHRLSWLYMTGNWPKNEIDHVNRIKSDNAWENLREANDSEQVQNQNKHRNNSSGYVGVSWQESANRWKAQIRHNKKHVYLGLFKTAEEAHEAYKAAKEKLHTFNPTVAK